MTRKKAVQEIPHYPLPPRPESLKLDESDPFVAASIRADRERGAVPPDWSTLPKYRVEMAALDDPAAAAELAKRAVEPRGSKSYWGRCLTAWLQGWNGEPDPQAHGRGGNWARPISRYWSGGKAKRAELEQLRQESPHLFASKPS